MGPPIGVSYDTLEGVRFTMHHGGKGWEDDTLEQAVKMQRLETWFLLVIHKGVFRMGEHKG